MEGVFFGKKKKKKERLEFGPIHDLVHAIMTLFMNYNLR